MSNREGLTNAQVLIALYNYSRPQGMGFLQAKPGNLSLEDAESELKHSTYVDYLHGRIIKVDVSEDPLDFRLYDRDLGIGAGNKAIALMLENLTRPR